MKIDAIKTAPVLASQKTLLAILDQYLPKIKENSILVITSKIVSLCEGRVVKMDEVDKLELITKEADYLLPAKENRYGITLTIKNSLLTPSAGIDESNGNGYFVLWPVDPQQTANKIREYLVQRFGLKMVGVIITDSRTIPLRWGTIGASISHSGFLALKDYIGKPDIFGRKFIFTKANLVDALSAAAVVVMGEGKEQTPLAVIEDVPFVHFQTRNPTKMERASLKISLSEDLYAPLLKSVRWRKGK